MSADGADYFPLAQGGDVNFSLFERKVTKEANQRAVGSLFAPINCVATAFSASEITVARQKELHLHQEQRGLEFSVHERAASI